MDRVENRSIISKLKACEENMAYASVRDYLRYREELASCKDSKRKKWLEKEIEKEYRNIGIDENGINEKNRYLSIKGERELREIIDKSYSKIWLTGKEKAIVANYFYFSNYALYSKETKFLENSEAYSEIIARFTIDFKPDEIKVLEKINQKYNNLSNKSMNEQVIDEINYQLSKLSITPIIKRLEELSGEISLTENFLDKIKIKIEMEKLRREFNSKSWEYKIYQEFINELKIRTAIKKYLNKEPITKEELNAVKEFIKYRFQIVKHSEYGKGYETMRIYYPHCHQIGQKRVHTTKIVSEEVDTNKVFSKEELKVLDKIYRENNKI